MEAKDQTGSVELGLGLDCITEDILHLAIYRKLGEAGGGEK